MVGRGGETFGRSRRMNLRNHRRWFVSKHVSYQDAHVADRQIAGDDGPDDRDLDQSDDDGRGSPYELHPQSWAHSRPTGHAGDHDEDDERRCQ